jgi:hypothetical protein
VGRCAGPLRDLTTRREAESLVQLAEEDWGGDVSLYREQDEIDRAMGTGRQVCGLLSMWWD